MLEDFRPPYDATVVARLKAADAVLIGKTNMDEFAMGGSTENSAFKLTRNPWDLARIPGGSSGGSAACVAAGMAPLAIGTDTGGSIRQPAGLCGVTGLKPTYGRVSRYGLVAFASSLDQIGPLARTAEDAALLLEAIAGHDPRDSTSRRSARAALLADRSTSRSTGLKLGIVREHFGEGLDAEVEAAVREAMRRLRVARAPRCTTSRCRTASTASPRTTSSPRAKPRAIWPATTACTTAIAPTSEMLAELAAERALEAGERWPTTRQPLVRMYRQSRAEGFGAEVKRRIMLGTYALSAGYYDAYYLKALKVRRLIRQDFDEAFEQVDLIVGPVTSTPAFKLGEKVERSAWRCTWSTSTPSAPTSPASPASPFPAASPKSACPSACNCNRPPSKKIACSAPRTCSSRPPTGTPVGRSCRAALP